MLASNLPLVMGVVAGIAFFLGGLFGWRESERSRKDEWLRTSADAARYRRLINQIGMVYRWCDGEAADVAQWLREGDADHWRPIDAPATGKLPPEISRFREYLQRWHHSQKAIS